MPTISSIMSWSALRLPDREALVLGDCRYTYAELDERIDTAARHLIQAGLAQGDRFALMGTNSDGFVIAFFAAARLGAIVVPVNPASAPPEVEYLLTDSGATVLAFEPSLTRTVAALAERSTPPTLKSVVSLGASEDHSNILSPDEEGLPPLPAVHIDESDDALILYTSGTTGNPKGACFDHHRAIWTGINMVSVAGMREGDRFLHAAPLYHAAELCIMLIPGVMLAATHVLVPAFDPKAVVDLLESERITMFFGVPTMYQMMLRVPDLTDRDLSSWRTGLFGAAPMPASAVQQVQRALPNLELIQLCGQTEAGPGGIFSSSSQVRERPDASGRQALPLTECRVVNSEGSTVAPGEVGELILRGVTVMKGYWNKPDETAATIVDGWLHTGDLARLDADGYMTLVDRLKDLIITGGRNVYSVEVENALAGHPDVVDCAIVGRPHPEYGESIVAYATVPEGASLTLEDVRAFCSEHIAHYKLPHDLVVVEGIPRNPSGKVLKHVLRATA